MDHQPVKVMAPRVPRMLMPAVTMAEEHGAGESQEQADFEGQGVAPVRQPGDLAHGFCPVASGQIK